MLNDPTSAVRRSREQVCNLVFLYKGDEPGSTRLCRRMTEGIPPGYSRLWSDSRASDSGFNAQLIEELSLCDVIVHCVGPKGLGFYQSLNEIDKTIDALRQRPERRLIVVLLDGTELPAELNLKPEFAERMTVVPLHSEDPDAQAVIGIAMPAPSTRSGDELADFANKIIKATLRAVPSRGLTIVVSPYAVAEATHPKSTPARAIRQFLRDNQLRGDAPWLDVIGSIAQATTSTDDEAFSAFHRALDVSTGQGAGQLGLYLRMFAANWSKARGSSRLFIVLCEPDMRIDLALRSSATPVQHVRLVNKPRMAPSMLAQRVAVANGRAIVTDLDILAAGLEPQDRVVLIKPLGCMENAEIRGHALITTEHWRASSKIEMDLPFGVAGEIRKSCLLVLGAGVFSPSFQFVFQSLLKTALARADNNKNRFLVHDPQCWVADPLHRMESSLASKDPSTEIRSYFNTWLSDTYGLFLHPHAPLKLVGLIDKLLNDFQATAGDTK